MCKRIKKQGRGVTLVPDNSEYESIRKKGVDSFKILGKVLIWSIILLSTAQKLQSYRNGTVIIGRWVHQSEQSII